MLTAGMNYVYGSVVENKRMLRKARFFDLFGDEWIFEDIQDALQHARHGTRLVSHVNDAACHNEIVITLYWRLHFQHPCVSDTSALTVHMSKKHCNKKQVLLYVKLCAPF